MSEQTTADFGLDANIVSFDLKGNDAVERNINRTRQNGSRIFIPPFAYYEVKRGLVAINATRQLRQFAQLCVDCPVGNLDDTVIEEAVNIHVELKAKGRPTDDVDVFIAAYCKVHGLTLVTNNTKHFAAISGLSLVDWSVE
jgi:predicted nucleic acid-binding protein